MLKDPSEDGAPANPRPPQGLDPAWLDAMWAKAARITKVLLRHRERYLKAWTVQTGLLPSDAVLVERAAWDAEKGCMAQIVEVMSKDEAARRFK